MCKLHIKANLSSKSKYFIDKPMAVSKIFFPLFNTVPVSPREVKIMNNYTTLITI